MTTSNEGGTGTGGIDAGIDDTAAGDHAGDLPRILGSYDAGRPGPLFLVVGGLHGNEPAGVAAARRVIERVEQLRLPLAGRLVALTGNREALARGARFVDVDLNRCWTDGRLARLAAQGADSSEEGEMRDILAVLETELAEAPGPIVLLDLHSTSAAGPPFTILADTLQNRRIAKALPIPVVMGLEERIEGPLLSWFADRGHAALVVEGGAHEDPDTVLHHEAAIWLTLVAAGGLERGAAAEIEDGRRRLARVARGLPPVVEVRHAHGLSTGDDFVMRAGFANFQRVRSGDLLATSDGREVRAPWEGYVLMPLYQGQGEDGFFLCRAVSGIWLRLSSWARSSGLERLLPRLPGLEREPRLPGALLAGRPPRPSVAWVLRLFGFRKHAPRGAREVYRRRSETLV